MSLKLRLVKGLIEIFLWIRHPKMVLYFIRRTGKLPNMFCPQTVNDKFLWRKLFDYDPRFVILSDKLACKEWVAARVPELNIPTVRWTGSSAESFPHELKGKAGLLKANHGSDTNLFLGECKLLEEKIESIINDWLAYDHGQEHREWAYSQVKRKIFIEDEIIAQSGALEEVKVFTHGRDAVRLHHIGDRFQGKWANAWDITADGVLLISPEPASIAPSNEGKQLPGTIHDAIAMARVLGAEFDQMRVDFLFDGKAWWLGELTVYNEAGYVYLPSANDPDSRVSRAWDIRKSAFLKDQSQTLTGFKRFYASVLKQYLNRISFQQTAVAKSPAP